jgi:tetratricopeptide (TPR) repeat protein
VGGAGGGGGGRGRRRTTPREATVSRDAGQLRDEIDLREASLVDATRERDAGELSDVEFTAICEREQTKLEGARNDLAALGAVRKVPVQPATPRVRRTRWLVVALVCFALALGVILYSAISPRQAGNSVTGSLSLGRAQQISQLLTEAEADVANSNPVAALSAYHQVLALDPSNVQALTQSGWLDFSAGSAAHNSGIVELGIKNLEKAIALAPRQPAVRLYFAIVADATPGNAVIAKKEFKIFLALSPSPGQLVIAKPFLNKLGLHF